jgi:tetratricopeptide (TPR) repeat protein
MNKYIMRSKRESFDFVTFRGSFKSPRKAIVFLSMLAFSVTSTTPALAEPANWTQSQCPYVIAQAVPSVQQINAATSDKPEVNTLRAAVKANQVEFALTGDGVTTSRVTMTVTNKTDKALHLLIPANEVFRPNTNNVQVMLIPRDYMMQLKPHAEIQVVLDAFCASTKKMLPPPPTGVSFEIGSFPDPEIWKQLPRILAAAKDLDRSGRFNDLTIGADHRAHTIAQYAIWSLLGKISGRPEDRLDRDAVESDFLLELNEQVKHNESMRDELKGKGQLSEAGAVILDKKQKDALDKRFDMMLAAADLTVVRSKASDLPGVIGLPTDTAWGNLDQVGVRAFEKGDYTEAQELLEAAVAEAEKFGGQDVRLATSLVNLGRCLLEQGLSKDAEPRLERALTIREKTTGKESVEYSEALACLGTVFDLMGKAVDAEKLFLQALDIQQKKLGTTCLQAATTMMSLGKLYVSQNNLDAGERYFKQALGIRYSSLGSDAPAVADVNANLAAIYSKQGKYPQAEKLYSKALAADQKALGPQSAVLATILDGLAQVYKTTDRDKDAQTCLNASEVIKKTALGGNAALLASLPQNFETLTRVQNFAKGTETLLASVKELTANTDPKLLAAAQAEKAAKANRPVKDKWALVVGVSKYQDASIELKYPAKDAKDFAEFLIKDEHFAPDHVRLLVNEKATKENILDSLGGNWLPKAAGPDDLVVMYFSGHGSPSKADLEGVNYLVAYNTDKNKLFATGIPLQEITDLVKNRVHSDRMVMVMDACHSGAAEPGQGSKGIFRTTNVSVDQIVQGTGQFVICSSQPSQVSWESKRYPNSVFTHYLIEGLKSNGDKTKLGDACNYLKEKVEEEVRRDRDGEFQIPVVGTHWQGEAMLLAVPPANPGPGFKDDEFSVANAEKTASSIDSASKAIKTTSAQKQAPRGVTASKSLNPSNKSGSVTKKQNPPARH